MNKDQKRLRIAQLDKKIARFTEAKNYSLPNKMIEKQAYELAREIVLKTSHTMHLENQGLDEKTVKEAIKNRAKKIKDDLPKNLWR